MKTQYIYFGYRQKIYLLKRRQEKMMREQGELNESMVVRKLLENIELNQIAENIVELEDAVTYVKEYEKLI